MSLHDEKYFVPEDNWFAIGLSKQIKGKLHRTFFKGKPLIALRDKNGLPRAYWDRCPHRNAPLSMGKIKKNCVLQCPYHGWEFNFDGSLNRIPGIEDRKFANIKLGEIPVKENLGIIFAFFGEDKSQMEEKFDPIPEIDQPNFFWTAITKTTESDIVDVIENSLDPFHTHFIHAGILRTDKARRETEAKVMPKDWGALIRYEEKGKHSGFMSIFEGDTTYHYAKFKAPTSLQLIWEDPKGFKSIFTAFITPNKDGMNSVYVSIANRGPKILRYALEYLVLPFTRYILKQDEIILRAQKQNKDAFGEEKYISTNLDTIRPFIEKHLSKDDKIKSREFKEKEVKLLI